MSFYLFNLNFDLKNWIQRNPVLFEGFFRKRIFQKFFQRLIFFFMNFRFTPTQFTLFFQYAQILYMKKMLGLPNQGYLRFKVGCFDLQLLKITISGSIGFKIGKKFACWGLNMRSSEGLHPTLYILRKTTLDVSNFDISKI